MRGTGATKETNMWERSAEKEKEKEKEPANDGASSSKTRREDGCMRKMADPWARGGRAAAPQLGVLSTLTILWFEEKQAPLRASQQAPPTDADAVSGALASADTNPSISTSCGHG